MGFSKDPELVGRNGEVWRKFRIYGWTQERIGRRFNLSQGRVSAIIAEVEKEIGVASYGDLIKDSFETLRELKSRYMDLAEKIPAPVTAGNTGMVLVDPETKEVVRDHALEVQALAGVAKIDDMIAKRFGLNAPEKVQTEATVRYEVVGVQDGDLT